MNKISVYSVGNKFNRKVKKISVLSRNVFLSLKKDGYAVEIYLVGDNEIRRLNKKYRHKDMATNVLSFCEPKGFISAPSKTKYLGEIYIAPEYVEKRGQNIKLMVTHGILHLLGYDHIKRTERVKMERKEAFVLGKV